MAEAMKRIRPPEDSPPDKRARLIQKRERNPLVEKRMDMALREYRKQLKRFGPEGPSIFYGTARFKKSRKYKQTMSIFEGVVQHLDELRYMNSSEIPWEALIADWFEAVFDHYQRKWQRSPIPPQISPTNKVTLIFNIYTENYDKQRGDDGADSYWGRKPYTRTIDQRTTEAVEHRGREIANMKLIGPLWNGKRILTDLRQRYGDHVKSLDDYIKNGGLLDDHGKRRPAEWV